MFYTDDGKQYLASQIVSDSMEFLAKEVIPFQLSSRLSVKEFTQMTDTPFKDSLSEESWTFRDPTLPSGWFFVHKEDVDVVASKKNIS